MDVKQHICIVSKYLHTRCFLITKGKELNIGKPVDQDLNQVIKVNAP